MGKYPYALQLYTVRDHMDKNAPKTLAKVKQAGYDYVEVAGTYGLSGVGFQKLLDEAGLKAASAHAGFDDVTQNVPAVIDMARALHVNFIVVAGIDSRLTPDKQGWINCAKALDAGGAKLRDAGIQLCYHNHAHEFKQLDGAYIFDILFHAAQPANLAAEIDTFWVQYAGLDPADIIRKYQGRCPLLHVKDMRDAQSRDFAEMGRGILDWPAILDAASEAGTQWYIVEQDVCTGDSLDSAAISARFMAGL